MQLAKTRETPSSEKKILWVNHYSLLRTCVRLTLKFTVGRDASYIWRIRVFRGSCQLAGSLFEIALSTRPLLCAYKPFVVWPGFAPAGEALLFWQKDPKPMTPHPPQQIGRTRRQGGRANSLRSDKARQWLRASAQRAGWQASDFQREPGAE